MNTPELKVPTLRLRELTTLEVSVTALLCRRWKWRNDSPYWRSRVRECISVLRKLKQARWA